MLNVAVPPNYSYIVDTLPFRSNDRKSWSEEKMFRAEVTSARHKVGHKSVLHTERMPVSSYPNFLVRRDLYLISVFANVVGTCNYM